MAHYSRISIQVFTADFRWLWLMYVHGFNERYHCQACLRGHKTKKMHYDRPTSGAPFHASFSLDEYQSPYIYLCGVTARYDANLHVAFTPTDQEGFTIEDPRLSLEITNARQVPIWPVDADVPKEFSRCRNFQFGYRYLRGKRTTPTGLFGGQVDAH